MPFAVLALVMAILGGWWLLGRLHPPKRGPQSPAHDLSPMQAFEAGVRLGNAGRNLAATPYFRRALEQMGDSWQVRLNYSSSLYNGAQEVRLHLGKAEPATRSSFERMALIRESLQELGTAETMTSTSDERAFVIIQRAQTFQTFGFPLAALMEYRRAGALTPSARSGATRIEQVIARGGAETVTRP